MKKTIIAVIKKNRRIVQRAYPWSFIMTRVIGAVFALSVPLILYYFVFRKSISVEYIVFSENCNYLNYIVLGAVLNTLSFSTLMSVGRCLITEQREGTLDNFLLSPASRIGYYIGVYIEQFGRSLMEAAIILAFGLIVGARFNLNYVPSIFLCVIVSSVSFFSLSILVSTVMIYTRDTFLVQNTLYLIMSCMCGVIFPIEYFPEIIQTIAKAFPMTYALKIIRACANGNYSLNRYREDLLCLIIVSVIYFFIGYFGFKKYEKKLIEDVLA